MTEFKMDDVDIQNMEVCRQCEKCEKGFDVRIKDVGTKKQCDECNPPVLTNSEASKIFEKTGDRLAEENVNVNKEDVDKAIEECDVASDLMESDDYMIEPLDVSNLERAIVYSGARPTYVEDPDGA